MLAAAAAAAADSGTWTAGLVREVLFLPHVLPAGCSSTRSQRGDFSQRGTEIAEDVRAVFGEGVVRGAGCAVLEELQGSEGGGGVSCLCIRGGVGEW